MTRMVLSFLFGAMAAMGAATADSPADFSSDFKCGMTLSRNPISPANFIGSGENLLIIPAMRHGQRGFYTLDEKGAKFHPLPPEKAVRKNDRFYYHRFALEDPKTKTQSHIVYSDIIAEPEEAITVTMGSKDKSPYPLSVGVPVNDRGTQNMILNRFSLSLKNIPPMVQQFVNVEDTDRDQLNRAIADALSKIYCSCSGVAGLKKEVEILKIHPALTPFKAGTC